MATTPVRPGRAAKQRRIEAARLRLIEQNENATPQARLARLDQRLGAGSGADRERGLLQRQLPRQPKEKKRHAH